MGARLRTALVGACFVALLAAPSAHATFPGANGKIAFVRGNDIWTMNPDGSNQVNITNTPSPAEHSPAWSADGTQIAYARQMGYGMYGNPGPTAIWVMNADGSGQREVVPSPNDPHVCGPGALLFANYLGGPAWSPDGSKLVFHDYRVCWYDTEFQDSDLYTVNPDGTGQALLTRNGVGPSWSPDGTKVGYTGVCGGGGCGDVSWITPDGTDSRVVHTTNVSADYFIDWSPDGSLMDGCGERPGGFYCFTIHPDGTGYFEFPGRVVPGDWSPDGTKFLLSGVYTENLDGSGLTKIASGGAAAWQPLNRPPDCSSVTADPDTLRPANNRLVAVTIGGATDPDGNQVTLAITGVTQDEPIGHDPDAKLGLASDQVKLRAKRSGRGDGRVYRIAFKATDGRGGACSGTALVGVPRRKSGSAVDSAPPSYDSLVGTRDRSSEGQHGQQG